MHLWRLVRYARIALIVGGGLAFAQAHGATPLPIMADPNLQQCLTEHAAANGWQYAEQVTRLSCAQRGIASLGGMEQLPNLFVLDLSANALIDVGPLFNSSQLTKLNLSGNRRLS